MDDRPEAQALRARVATAAPSSRIGLAWTAVAALSLPLAYFASFGFSAWHPSDYEYVMACLYRIGQGELPYRDFIYHKPPATLYLHLPLLWLPGSGGVLASRLIFYLQLAATAFAPILWAVWRGQVAFAWRLPLLGMMALAIALHNHPAMSWQTSDGVFFCVVGLVAWAESLVATTHRRAVVMRCAASLSLLLGLLAKQSFVGLCMYFAFASVLEWALALQRGDAADRRRAWALLTASAAPGSLGVLLLTAALTATGMLEHFVAQIASQGDGSVIAQRLLWYSDSPYLWTLGVWIALPGLRLLDGPGARAIGIRVAAAIALVAFALATTGHAADPLHALGQLALFALAGTLLGRLVIAALLRWRASWPLTLDDARELTRPPLLLLHGGAFLTAWLCHLSLGYPSPLLGVAGLGLALHEVLPRQRSRTLDLVPALLACAIVLLGFFALNQQRPYRDEPRDRLTHDMGSNFPRLSGIKTHQAQHLRYRELVVLLRRHALSAHRPFVVTQDYPGIHWLLGEPNAWSIDWAYPPEPSGFEARLVADLVASRPIAVVPKHWTAPETGIGPPVPCPRVDYADHNVFSRVIAREWTLVGEGHDFCVFEPPAR